MRDDCVLLYPIDELEPERTLYFDLHLLLGTERCKSLTVEEDTLYCF